MSDIILYTTDDGHTSINLRLQSGTVWLTLLEMAELFNATKQNISLHLKNIFLERKLDENSVVKESLTTERTTEALLGFTEKEYGPTGTRPS